MGATGGVMLPVVSTVSSWFYLSCCRNCSEFRKVKSFPSHMAHRVALISTSVALSQTQRYGASALCRVCLVLSQTQRYGASALCGVCLVLSQTQRYGASALCRVCFVLSQTQRYGASALCRVCLVLSQTQRYGASALCRVCLVLSQTQRYGASALCRVCLVLSHWAGTKFYCFLTEAHRGVNNLPGITVQRYPGWNSNPWLTYHKCDVLTSELSCHQWCWQ